MSSLVLPLPPLSARIANGRPVLTREQLTALAERIMGMTSVDKVRVSVQHRVNIVTRMANGKVLSSDDGDQLWIWVMSGFGDKGGMTVGTNQLDDSVLRAIVDRSEAAAREAIGFSEQLRPYQRQVQDTYVPVQLWHDETIRAMTTTRGTVIPEVLESVARERLHAAGFLGLTARAQAVMTKEGIFAFSEETDAELTVTARGLDNKSSGWGGQAARNWSVIRPAEVAARAIDIAKRSANPVALEPGRRTAILGAPAVVQLMRYMSRQFDAGDAEYGLTAFATRPRGNKVGTRVFDPRINMNSDPADPDGGYCPYFFDGFATPPMTWVENGVLKNLAFNPIGAMLRGKTYSENPYSLSMSGGTTTIDEMIAHCKEGIYVNRFSDVDLVDRKTCLLTGTTRDGCFLVKDGKLVRPVKNFRFLESPFFFLNRVEALGVPERTAFGYTPRGNHPDGEGPYTDWPRYPMIVPPMMVRDFNFSALEDAI